LIERLINEPDFDVYGWAIGDNRLKDINFNYSSVDLTNTTLVNSLFEGINPDIVVHCAAISQVEKCEDDNQVCLDVNVEVTKNLTCLCQRKNTRLIFLSSDFVFNGKSQFVSELEKPDPISQYGWSKLLAEQEVRKLTNWGIVRPVLVYGFSNSASRGNIFTWVLESLKKDTSINVASDQYRTPTFVGDVINLIVEILNSPISTDYNIGGGERISVSNFAQLIGEVASLDVSCLASVLSEDIDGTELRPKNSCFRNEKIKSVFGIVPLNSNDGIRASVKQYSKREKDRH
jgi:dTDP-4-dehydrorhamnose reductase